MLNTLFKRKSPPEPWSEGDNIPWNNPEFSQRMLREHLSQDHDAASRKTEKIKLHVDWIHREVLSESPSRILDLGCGPGFYMQRLARLNHTCFGVDYSPASINYAEEQAKQENLDIHYVHEDVRIAEFTNDIDLLMMIYGEFNVFKKQDIMEILKNAYRSIKPEGKILLEPHNFEAIQAIGQTLPSWYLLKSGLFSENPHLYLVENFWNSSSNASTIRFIIVDCETNKISQYSASYQAYSDEEYAALLSEAGFNSIKFYPSLHGVADESQHRLMAIVARK